MDRGGGVDGKGDEIGTGGPRVSTLNVARILVGAALFATVIGVTAREWRDVSDTLADIGPVAMAATLVLALVGLASSAVTWRYSLREFGGDVSVPAALKIYLVGQLGKYIPGSVWALVIQMELARTAGARRTQSFGASVVAVGINIVTGSAVALAALPLAGGDSRLRYVGAGIGIVLCAVAIAPPVLGRIANLGMRLARQPTLDTPPSWSGILKAGGFSVASWLAYGLGLACLAIGAGAEPLPAIALALPAVALAMTIGFLIAVAPSGIGVREAVLVAALSPVLDPSAALAVAVGLRIVFTLADLIAAAATMPIRVTATRPDADHPWDALDEGVAPIEVVAEARSA
jgi:uncharacterized membrane protein YbhN (UPF0104 family)